MSYSGFENEIICSICHRKQATIESSVYTCNEESIHSNGFYTEKDEKIKICNFCYHKYYIIIDSCYLREGKNNMRYHNSYPQSHLDWLQDTGKTLTTQDGIPIKVFELNHTNDESILSNWAKHFRNHYCLDEDIDTLRDGTGKSRTKYLNDLVFPDTSTHSGPATRSGDFGEILVSDYVEYLLGYWVPRTRFSERQNRSNPTQGVDVLGLKMLDPHNKSSRDELLIYEVKGKLTSNAKDESQKRLEIAIKDSAKDFNVRKAESLNALKRYYMVRQQRDKINIIQRFQNPIDNPYIELSGASAIILTNRLDDSYISQIHTSVCGKDSNEPHPNQSNLQLIIISGDNLMNLVHHLYERGADEA
ncbi:MAG: SAVED domain-containing protein [Sulfurovum sp.]